MEREAIENIFIDHSSNLSSDPGRKSYFDILHSLPSDPPVISIEDGQNLVRKISKNEIFKALMSLNSGKKTWVMMVLMLSFTSFSGMIFKMICVILYSISLRELLCLLLGG